MQNAECRMQNQPQSCELHPMQDADAECRMQNQPQSCELPPMAVILQGEPRVCRWLCAWAHDHRTAAQLYVRDMFKMAASEYSTAEDRSRSTMAEWRPLHTPPAGAARTPCPTSATIPRSTPSFSCFSPDRGRQGYTVPRVARVSPGCRARQRVWPRTLAKIRAHGRGWVKTGHFSGFAAPAAAPKAQRAEVITKGRAERRRQGSTRRPPPPPASPRGASSRYHSSRAHQTSAD